MPAPEKIVLIGAGLTGPLLATYMAQKGFDVEIFERRYDMRKMPTVSYTHLTLPTILLV